MLDLLDQLIVREFVASLPRRERAVAELLMFGHSQASAARALRITGRMVRHRMQTIRRGFSFDLSASARDAAGCVKCPSRRSDVRRVTGPSALNRGPFVRV